MPSPNSLTIASAWPSGGVRGLVFDMHELYQVLGVCTGAADEESKVAFRRLAKQLHPDLHPGDADAERRLQDVRRAYETLSDRAHDAGLANQRLMRRWRFRTKAMTVVTVFALTVSVGLRWRVLSETLLPAENPAARLAGNATRTAMLDKAERVSSTLGELPKAVEEPGDAAPNESPELNAELSNALRDHSSPNEIVDGLLVKPTTAEAPSLQFLPLGDLASSDLTVDPAIKTIGPQRSEAQAPNRAQIGSGAARRQSRQAASCNCARSPRCIKTVSYRGHKRTKLAIDA